MAKHIVALFYGFSVFLGICNLILIGIMLYKNKNEKGHRLLLFFVAFFCYGFMNLIIYYNQHIMEIPRLYIPMGLVQNITFLGMGFLWVWFAASDTMSSRMRLGWRAFEAVCMISLILWAMDSIFFLDEQFHVLNQAGNLVSTLLEGMLLLLMFVLLAVFLKNRKFPLYESIGSLIIVGYYLAVFIRDVRISFFGLTIVDLVQNNTISLCPIFLVLINILTAMMLIPQIVEHLFRLRELEQRQAEREMSIEEMKEEYSISNREADVLRLICQGMNNAQIAETLFISENTVKKHVNSIFRKMNVSSRPELISQIRVRETQ